MGVASRENAETQGGAENLSDPDVFAALYRQAYPKLRLIAAGIIGDASHADDIVQEAAIIALRKSDQFVAGSSFAAWLSEIVRRCSLNYARKIRKRKTMPADPRLLAETKTDSSASTGRWPIVAETGKLIEDQADFDDEVLQALNDIAPQARCCLLLRSVQSLSYAEIAELMRIPEGTAMSHVHRSKKILRKRLIERGRSATDEAGN